MIDVGVLEQNIAYVAYSLERFFVLALSKTMHVKFLLFTLANSTSNSHLNKF